MPCHQVPPASAHGWQSLQQASEGFHHESSFLGQVIGYTLQTSRGPISCLCAEHTVCHAGVSLTACTIHWHLLVYIIGTMPPWCWLMVVQGGHKPLVECRDHRPGSTGSHGHCHQSCAFGPTQAVTGAGEPAWHKQVTLLTKRVSSRDQSDAPALAQRLAAAAKQSLPTHVSAASTHPDSSTTWSPQSAVFSGTFYPVQRGVARRGGCGERANEDSRGDRPAAVHSDPRWWARKPKPTTRSTGSTFCLDLADAVGLFAVAKEHFPALLLATRPQTIPIELQYHIETPSSTL